MLDAGCFQLRALSLLCIKHKLQNQISTESMPFRLMLREGGDTRSERVGLRAAWGLLHNILVFVVPNWVDIDIFDKIVVRKTSKFLNWIMTDNLLYFPLTEEIIDHSQNAMSDSAWTHGTQAHQNTYQICRTSTTARQQQNQYGNSMKAESHLDYKNQAKIPIQAI